MSYSLVKGALATLLDKPMQHQVVWVFLLIEQHGRREAHRADEEGEIELGDANLGQLAVAEAAGQQLVEGGRDGTCRRRGQRRLVWDHLATACADRRPNTQLRETRGEDTSRRGKPKCWL